MICAPSNDAIHLAPSREIRQQTHGGRYRDSFTLGDNDRSIFMAASGQILMAANTRLRPSP
jgi:hypothetical protein